MQRSQLEWRCRRGMKELDLPLRHYLDHHYPQATPDEQQTFRQLLEEPDDRLWSALYEQKPLATPELTALVHTRLSGHPPRN